MSTDDFSLGYVVTAIRRRLPIFLACLLLVPFAAVVYSVLQDKEYTASAVLLFRNPEFERLLGPGFIPSQQDPQREQATNQDLVTLKRVSAATAARLHMSQKQVSKAVSASGQGQADLVSVKATDRSPAFAAKLANTFAREFIAFRRSADRATVRSARLSLERRIAQLSTVDRSGTVGRSMRQQLGQLNLLTSLQTGNAELVQPAQAPGSPSSPKPVRNGALGLFFGLVLAVGVVVSAEALDRRLREPRAVQELLGHPVVGYVPADGRASLDSAEGEAFQILRANLDFLASDQPLKSIAVTSAVAQEGKSTVASALGSAQARAGKSTLLLECDLRRPSLAERAGVPGAPGLVDYLAGKADPEEVTRSLPVGPAAATSVNGGGAGTEILQPGRLDLIPAGPPQPGTGVVLGSQTFREFFAEVRRAYDVVIVDCSPLLPVADTLEVIPQVDAVILCVRSSRTTTKEAEATREVLARLPARPTGVVLTGIRPGVTSPYPYYYREAYASQPR